MKLLDFDGVELVTADDFEFEDVPRLHRRSQPAKMWWIEAKPRRRRRLRTPREPRVR